MSAPRYFLAAGKSLALCTTFLEERDAALETSDALQAEFGATTAYFRGPYLVGFGWQGPPPPSNAWRLEDGVAVPNKRTKAGRALAERLAAIQLPHLGTLTRDLIGDLVCVGFDRNGGYRMSCVALHRFDHELVIEVPAAVHVADEPLHDPPDAVPLLASEHWRRVDLREASELPGHARCPVRRLGGPPAGSAP